MTEINIPFEMNTYTAQLIAQQAKEIENLRTINTELVKVFKQVGVVAQIWQKTEDELIELHHGICADQFAKQADEIERLRKAIRHQYLNDGICYGENCEQCNVIYELMRHD